MNDNIRHDIYDDEGFWIMEECPYDYDEQFVMHVKSLRPAWFIESYRHALMSYLSFIRMGHAMKQAEIMCRRIDLIENNRKDDHVYIEI